MINPTKVIDLAQFGQEGIVELRRPSARRKNELENELGKCVYVEQIDGKPVVKGALLGDQALVKMLVFVHKAPFQPTLNGFLNYCDMMDEKDLGSAERLIDAIEEGIKEVVNAPSPLAD